jgi:putative N6-adenine-specific DNA methylase
VPLVRASRGGVYFGGELQSALWVCLQSRIAARVLHRQTSFDARNPDELYDGVRDVPWERVLDAGRTLAVDANVRDAPIGNSAFAAQRVKDAIVDRLRDLFGARPDVDKRDPDVRVVLHWVRESVTVSLDVGGASLHARGYRPDGGEAPLKENLAAAIIRLCGWDRTSTFIDPLCGSGTLAIEAAQWARRIAPGLLREPFGAERWASHDQTERALLRTLRESAQAEARPIAEGPAVFARDADDRVLALARQNAARAGVQIEFARADMRKLHKEHDQAWLITNPPYGERLSQDTAGAADLADVFSRLSGYHVCALTHDRSLPQVMRQRPVLEHALWNGPIECRLFRWDIA